MNCEDAVDLVVDSLMDSLAEDQVRALERHIEGCESCALEAEKLKEAWEGLSRIPSVDSAHDLVLQPAEVFGMAGVRARAGRRSSRARRAAAAAALFILGGVGGYVGRGIEVASGPPQNADPTFLFLVRGREPDASIPSEVLTAEYRVWAAGLAGAGRLAGANKLMDGPGRWVSGSSTGDSRGESDVQGYFLIRAPNYAEAEALASESPHIRYGGTFEIRELEPSG